ncbi:TetR family transcriptional regulator [Actinocorallia longicatena]|uniref:TetR family transcriptional regulator n=1 Tax=Actinocorallia longicatena TaxID=111803 RepID=A0ABP6QFS1_9ACTN
MGRQEKRVQTRNALLDAAQRLWAERGIHGASLDDIAASAGLTKGAVYSNFTGKTDLLLALLERYTTSGAELCGGLNQPDWVEYAKGLGTDESRLLAQLLVEFWLYGMRDYAAGWRVADWYQSQRDGLAERFDGEEGAEGETDGVSPTDRATLAMAMDLGLALQHLLDPERVPPEVYASGMRMVMGDRHAVA